MITISIAIPTYNNDEILDKCLESLEKENFDDHYKEIIIISNGPKTSSKDILNNHSFPIPKKHIYIEKASVSIARNEALMRSTADIVLFFDNDMTFTGQTLRAYSEGIKKHGKNYFYGGPVEPNYEQTPPDWLRKFLPWSAKGHSLGEKEKLINKALFLGGNHAVPRIITSQLAQYDMDSPLGEKGLIGEEIRVQEKLLKNNISGVYLPDALTYHYVPKNRCSPEWALHRNYRTGFTEGKNIAHSNRTFLNIPYWVLNKFIKLNLEYLFLHLSNNQKKFDVLFEIYYYKGLIDSKREKDLPTIHLTK